MATNFQRQFPVGIRNLTDVYHRQIHSMLEPWEDLQEGFVPSVQQKKQYEDRKHENEDLLHMKKAVKKDVDDLNEATQEYYPLKDLIENKVQPVVDRMYPLSPSPQLETESQQSLKMQYQDDARSMIQGTNNLFIITGIACTTVTVFLILSSL